MVQVLRFGYVIPFHSPPPLSSTPIPLPSYTPSSIRGVALAAAVKDLLSKGAIEPASSCPGFYSRLLVTPKVSDGWRLVIDLSFLNRFVSLSHFHMETAQSVLQSLRSGDWLISLDLLDAYLQVPVHPQSRRFLRFCIGSQVYQFRVLCFGLSSAPLVFTRVMAPVSSIMHRSGYGILRYLDDWLVLGSSQLEIIQARDFLLLLCVDLGIRINLAKSSLQPAQRLDYLGMTLQSTPLQAFPTQARIHKVLCLVDEFSSSPERPLSLWCSLLGVMSSLSTLIPGSRLRMRLLQHCLLVSHPRESPTALVSWDTSCQRDLQWWSVPSHLSVGVDLSLPRPDLVLYTDASDTGWGASLGSDHLSGWWSRDVSLYSINHRELLAIFLAIRGFLPRLRGQTVSLFTDNPSALSYLRKEGGTRSSTLNEVAQATLHLCVASDLCLLPQFVPGHLSRRGQVLGSEWTLHQEVCRNLFRLWQVTVDLFATSLNHRLQVYFSPMADPQAAAVDSLVQSWDNLQAYAFPPFGLLQRVLSKVRGSHNLVLTLMALFWPLCPWFADLLDLLVEVPVLLPLCRDLLRQPHFHHFHGNLRALALNWVSHCQRSARHFGFSVGVVGQLAFSRRPSTRLNYQSKWSTYRAWCHSHGHSVCRPTVPKIADFLLYLRRSLHLSYSTVASYRSMLSAAFRFLLPELSSHPVLHDLLCSFRVERPLSSSHFPSWDLLRVLSLLRGFLFEPLESCSLRDLTQKTLFLLSLVTARHVGELQAVSAEVSSSSGGDLFLSYLPEFRAKSESAANPLPRSFWVRSLRDFVGSLPGEMSLCPVRALQVYLRCTASLSPRPRFLFVSPRAPSRPMSKNALSFFLRSVISLSFPPAAAPPSSSSRAHSIRGVSTSLAFSRNVPFASILAAATWSSSTVFTSFYLRDMQFSSSSGFSLGPVVAADAVV